MDRRLDPRSIVTPYAFAVHPDLLGKPLATPWQRFGAIFIDLIVIGFLTLVGFGPLAILSVALLFWLATRKESRDRIGKAFKIAAGCLGVFILGVVLLVFAAIRSDIGQQIREGIESGGDFSPVGAVDDAGARPGELDLGGLFQGVVGAVSLESAETGDEALPLLTSTAQAAYDTGMPRNQVRALLEDLLPEDVAWADDADGLIDAAVDALQVSAPTEETGAGEEILDPTEAGADRAAEEAPEDFSEAALDSLNDLNRVIERKDEDIEDLENALAETEATLDEERNRNEPFVDRIINLLDEAGLGFGWGALYLTIAHTLFRGRSIGKMIFRIRVVMIDQRPLNWWLSFERAGGYAAGFATGLLGFAQVFWDPNRQAIHDKVSETIVIQDGKAPVPGPWIAEGKAQWERGRNDRQPHSKKSKP